MELSDRSKSVALLVVTLLSIELCLNGLANVPTQNATIVRLKDLTSPGLRNEDFFWKKRFLDRYEQLSSKTIPMSLNEYRVDARLGWVPRENVSLVSESGETYTTNGHGFRSLDEYAADDDERLTVLILGDSFTYGIGADDSEVWPTILQDLDEEIRVLNMGVAGYGIDQMYLMLERHIGQFEPDLVIAAFITDDLRRSTLSFRAFQKPRFEIDNGDLVLVNTPVPGIEEVAQRLRNEVQLERLMTKVRTLNLLLNAYASLRPKGTRWREIAALNDRILGEMIALCDEYDAEFLLLYLPSGRALRDAQQKDAGERYFRRFVQHNGIRGLNPRPLFLATDPSVQFSLGHYRRPAATVVARAVHAEIATLPIYRNRHQ